MGIIILIAAGVTALVGQWLNTHKSIPTETVKAILAVSGIPFYAWAVGLPPVWWGPGFDTWSIGAIVWMGAIPGFASLIGTTPGMRTDSRP